MTCPNGEIRLPNPDPEPLKSTALPPVNDLRIRLIMIPLFGIAIPHLTGYFGPYGPANVQYWIGLAWAIVISATIWHGNRYFLLKQRQHFDWFRHALRKLTVLTFACVFYTMPVTVVMMLAWYWYAGFGPDWNVILTLTLVCVIRVAFITHVYETVYLIQQRESDLLAVERLDRARTQAELDALRAQVAPHFLFNSLNTLSALIENNPSRALEFNQNLAEVYRYILLSRRQDLVPLEEELQFLRQYVALLKLRFENSFEFDWDRTNKRTGGWYVPPMSLQLLVENAVKHNEHSSRNPLRVEISFDESSVAITNEVRHRAVTGPTPGIGLRTLDERCRLVLGRGIEILNGNGTFTVRVPLRAT